MFSGFKPKVKKNPTNQTESSSDSQTLSFHLGLAGPKLTKLQQRQELLRQRDQRRHQEMVPITEKKARLAALIQQTKAAVETLALPEDFKEQINAWLNPPTEQYTREYGGKIIESERLIVGAVMIGVNGAAEWLPKLLEVSQKLQSFFTQTNELFIAIERMGSASFSANAKQVYQDLISRIQTFKQSLKDRIDSVHLVACDLWCVLGCKYISNRYPVPGEETEIYTPHLITGTLVPNVTIWDGLDCFMSLTGGQFQDDLEKGKYSAADQINMLVKYHELIYGESIEAQRAADTWLRNFFDQPEPKRRKIQVEELPEDYDQLAAMDEIASGYRRP